MHVHNHQWQVQDDQNYRRQQLSGVGQLKVLRRGDDQVTPPHWLAHAHGLLAALLLEGASGAREPPQF